MTTAVLFQALPPLSPAEYGDLEKSILEIGIQVPIIKDEYGVVIDGHHRQKISIEHGIHCPSEVRAGLTDTQKRDLALSLNLHRRHLTREQKRALVAESIKADPQLSDREHGRRTGVSPQTATKVRDELEDNAQVEHKPPNERMEASGRRARGAASKPNTQPEPKVKRKPITDQFFTAAYELRKRSEVIVKIANDDRFPMYATSLRESHLSDLERIHASLGNLINTLKG